ncbi:MAG: hypothetical protein M1135_03120 [Candidatus Omnitrophica bacterium]|nr:hypothetical protein [Candidatus Omnitrophota bacterium]
MIKTFIKKLADEELDLIQIFLDIIKKTRSKYCIIGGLGVNAYVEPVVSLDLDFVVLVANIKQISTAAKKQGLQIKKFEHSINICMSGSDIRIQIQTDPRYQEFIKRAKDKNVLGYKMKVASLKDILQGKIWAYQDKERRKSKRQKDLADIIRLVEKYPELIKILPSDINSMVS